MALQGNLHYIIMQLNQNLNKTEKKNPKKQSHTYLQARDIKDNRKAL